MALHQLEMKKNSRLVRLVSVKYCIFGSFKEGMILSCQISFKMKTISS